MDIAFACPKCHANVITNTHDKYECVFCHTPLLPENQVEKLDGGFYFPEYSALRDYYSYECPQCKTIMFSETDLSSARSTCIVCGKERVPKVDNKQHPFPKAQQIVPFYVDANEAKEAFEKSMKEKFFLSGKYTKLAEMMVKTYLPVYIFDYEAFTSAIVTKNLAEKVPTTYKNDNQKRVENTAIMRPMSSTDGYYVDRNVGGQFRFNDIPIPASDYISNDSFDDIGPYSFSMSKDFDSVDKNNAIFVMPNRSGQEIMDDLIAHIKLWVRGIWVSEEEKESAVVSYVDQSKYEESLGILTYFPYWQIKTTVKGKPFHWLMNAVNGRIASSRPIYRPSECRAYLDIPNSSALIDIAMNENAVDKVLIRMERNVRVAPAKVVVNQKNVEEAYHGVDSDKFALERQVNIPSAPVPLPEKHSEIYLSIDQARSQQLGRGSGFFPATDRSLGSNIPKAPAKSAMDVALEIGLEDIPEFDSEGPSPFKKTTSDASSE